MLVQLTPDEARRFLVRRHLFDPPRSLSADAQSVLEVVARLGSLQFDPLEAPGARNHDLVLHARIAHYHRVWLSNHLYSDATRRTLFEAYNKSLNILPIDELPHYRVAWDRARLRYAKTVLSKRSRSHQEIVARITEEGALSTSAFKDSHKKAIDWHWAPTGEGRAVLEALFEAGHVGIARREGNRRWYDLIERVFPSEILARRVSEEESLRHKLLSRYRGHGLLGPSANAELWVGIAKSPERARLLERLVAEGELLRVSVEGVRGERYIIAREEPILKLASRELESREVTFLAPLDPILWDRRLLRSLFDFDYIWEVYTPEAKRRHGYYVLPILFGDRLIARIEPRFERATATLQVIGLWWERGFDPGTAPGFFEAFARAFQALLTFTGATRITWPTSKVGRELKRVFATHQRLVNRASKQD